jgi:hypothetical protein
MRRLSIFSLLLVVSCATQQPSGAPTPQPATTAPQAEVVAPSAPAPEEGLRPNENLIFGHGYKFALVTPAGLISDGELARNLRIGALFYPPGSSWNDALAFTARVVEKTATAGLAEIVAQDEAQYKESTPAVEISEQPSIPLSSGASARVRSFRDEPHSLNEAVAYIDQSKTVALVVLRANSNEEFKKGWPLFDALVRSYRNLEVPAGGGGAD